MGRSDAFLVCVVIAALSAVAAEAAGEPLRVDIDCDGKPDRVFLKQDENSASLRVVYGNAKLKPTTMRIGAGRGLQNAVCTMPARVEPESLDYAPGHEEVPRLPGFRRSGVCTSFALVDGECDSMHFYWNHSAKKLQWWRR